MLMQTTSHFIGVSLDSKYFVNTFIALQRYFKEHDLEKAVEFQNVLSLHITLYYLDKELTGSEKEQLQADIASLRTSKEFVLTGLKASYFGEPGKERVCYVGCAENEVLRDINKYFAEKYKFDQIPENQLSFVSHISLFRITDSGAFASHRAAVDEIINATIESIETDELVTGLHLFQVSSLFHPEIQIALQ
jgi:2'-5' RNA ligase